MLESKDYIITMFREEIERKNQHIELLLERQDHLETKLCKIEAVLMFDDKDMEAHSGVKKVQEITIQDEQEVVFGQTKEKEMAYVIS